jgi:exopolysaccharide production protein ExoZ
VSAPVTVEAPVRTRYLHGLDVLRIVASIAVVWVHTRDWFASGQQGWWLHDATRTVLLDPLRLSSLLAGFAVGAFFVISGLVVTRAAAKESVGRFFARRAVRILPALWVVLIAIWVCAKAGLPVGVQGAGDVDTGALVANMTLANFFTTGNPGLDLVTWTLTVQVAFYLYAGATIPLLRRWPWLPPALGVAVVSVVLSAVDTEDTPALHTIRVIATLVPILFVGQVIGLVQSGRLHPLAGIGYGVAHLLLLVRADLTSDHTPAIPGYPQIVVWLVLLTIILSKVDGRFLRSAWLAGFAARTYAIFLVHVPVLYVTPHILSTTAGTTAAFFLALGGTTVTAELLYRFVEAPAVRCYRRWERSRTDLRRKGPA